MSVSVETMGAPVRSGLAWVRSDNGRRLGAWILGALVLALMTGPSGNNSAPTAGFTGSLLHPRVLVFLGLGVTLWVLDHRPPPLRGAHPGRERPASPGRRAGSCGRAGPATASTWRSWPSPSPTLPPCRGFWQEVLVDQIGVFVLLAIGLNVVVGYAGLLDLGYIAFYAIGAYSAAYWTGALPVHPPFHVNPFCVIPLAVLAAMLAGVILGTPTLRLRGDYLAIVTLGFGEIIQIVATNLQAVTGGARGGERHPPLLGPRGRHPLQLGSAATCPTTTCCSASSWSCWWSSARSRTPGWAGPWPPSARTRWPPRLWGSTSSSTRSWPSPSAPRRRGSPGFSRRARSASSSSQDFTVQLSILVLVLVIFGGMGSLPGAVAGAAFLQWVPRSCASIPLFGYQPQDLYIYLGALLVVMMIFRPEGITPVAPAQREIVPGRARRRHGRRHERFGRSRRPAVTVSAEPVLSPPR